MCLHGYDSEQAKKWIDEASEEAKNSPCEKSKRGILIVKNGEVLARGHNRPPLGMPCQTDKCYSVCADYTIHAEENAITEAKSKGVNLEGAVMYHAKVKEGRHVKSGEPSCARCSSKVLDSGISYFSMWQKSGYILYGAREFHELSLESVKKAHQEMELSNKLGLTETE